MKSYWSNSLFFLLISTLISCSMGGGEKSEPRTRDSLMHLDQVTDSIIGAQDTVVVPPTDTPRKTKVRNVRARNQTPDAPNIIVKEWPMPAVDHTDKKYIDSVKAAKRKEHDN